MKDVTRILSQIEKGDPEAAEDLLPLVYEELRTLAAAKMVHESPDHTLQATALVHEAYLRLVDAQQTQHWNSRGHFFGAAAEAMRRILVDRARRKQAVRHGGNRTRVDLEAAFPASDADPDVILKMDAAIAEFARESPEKAELIRLRYFAGLRQVVTRFAISPDIQSWYRVSPLIPRDLGLSQPARTELQKFGMSKRRLSCTRCTSMTASYAMRSLVQTVP